MNESITLLNSISSVWSGLLFWASLRAAIAILFVWALCAVFRRIPPFVQCWLWRLAYVTPLLALCWFYPVELPLLPASTASATPASAISARSVDGRSPVGDEQPEAAAAAVEFVETSPDGAVAGNSMELEATTSQGIAWAVTARLSVASWLFLVWMVGVVVSLLRLSRHWHAVRNLTRQLQPVTDAALNAAIAKLARRLGLRRPPALLLLPTNRLGPFLVGIRRPAIVLRWSMLQDCTAAELDMVLAHELAHLRRRDLVWNWLPWVVEIVFFFHPFVWFSRRPWQLTQEMATDELAISASGAAADEYAHRLLSVVCKHPQSNARGGLVVAMSRSFDTLNRRLAAMKTYRTRSFSSKLSVFTLVALAGIVGVVPWKATVRAQSSDAPPAIHPADAQTPEGVQKTGGEASTKVGQKPSAEKKSEAFTEGVNYLVIPAKGARTDLQKTFVSSQKGAEVLIDGTAVVTANGTIKGNALALDKLRSDLQPLADKKRNILYVHIYYSSVENSRNAKDLLLFSLHGFGRHAGFHTTRVYNHYQGGRFQFEDLIESRKKRIAVGDEGDEPVSGNALVKVYPVRTALSRSKCADADCVVEIVPRFANGPANALPPKLADAIRRYVSRLKVKQKRTILFKVTCQGDAGRKTVDWFAESGAKALAQSLGYQAGVVRNTPY